MPGKPRIRSKSRGESIPKQLAHHKTACRPLHVWSRAGLYAGFNRRLSVPGKNPPILRTPPYPMLFMRAFNRLMSAGPVASGPMAARIVASFGHFVIGRAPVIVLLVTRSGDRSARRRTVPSG